jgi:hypothetical protein
MAISSREEFNKGPIIAKCEDMGEDAVRAEIDINGGRLIRRDDIPIAREWLYKRDRERNEKVMQENATATRRNTRIAAISAFFAGVAAVAALVTAIITSCHSGSP